MAFTVCHAINNFSAAPQCSLQTPSKVAGSTVLGPLLFVMYINDVTTTISQSSMINMFADDIAYYRIIQSRSDYTIVRKDVDYISSLGQHTSTSATVAFEI